MVGILILANAILFLALIYSMIHEEKLIEIEDRVLAKFRKKIRVSRREKMSKWLAKDGLTVCPMFEEVE